MSEIQNLRVQHLVVSPTGQPETEPVCWQVRHYADGLSRASSNWVTAPDRDAALRMVKSYCDSGLHAEWRALGVTADQAASHAAALAACGAQR